MTNLEPGDVLFIDEIHRLSPFVEEILYPAMEDYQLDIMIGEGPAARSIKLDLPPFTLVGATTGPGLLTSPLRDRFGIVQRLEFYEVADLGHIVQRSADILEIGIDPRGRGGDCPPCKGNSAYRQPSAAAGPGLRRGQGRWRDYSRDCRSRTGYAECGPAWLRSPGSSTIAGLVEKFDGGPVGVDSLAAAISEERGTIEDVLEPYLIQQGFVLRTPRGRMATRSAYLHFGLPAPSVAGEGDSPSLDLKKGD